MSELCVQADDLWKSYGRDAVKSDALRGVSLGIQPGEFVAIRGPSGCGKSTLLHLLGAMDRPTAGRVWLQGRRLDQLSADQLAGVRRKQIGFVFQAFNLLPTLTIQENVSLPLLLEGIPDSDSVARSLAALTEVGLADRLQAFPSQLSGGEMQRVAIARAVAMKPDLVIADEPTGSLDSVNGRRVLELLTHLNRSNRMTVLMATHSEEAASFASRVLHLRDGQIEKEVVGGVLSSSL